MKNIENYLCMIAASLMLFPSCDIIPDIQEVEEVAEVSTDAPFLNIPDGFDFSTQHQIEVSINDNLSNVSYDVYAFSDEKRLSGSETFENEEGETVTEEVYKTDVMSKLVFSGVPMNGNLSQTVTLPKYYDKIYIRRNDNLKYSASIVNIVNNKVHYTYVPDLSSAKRKVSSVDLVTDFLYCVNGSGELFQIDPLTGDLVYLSDMPMGSYTCAIDQANKVLYSVGTTSPYPLMKYSITNDTWETIADTGTGEPRLDYNKSDGLLYFSKNDFVRTYDPSTGAKLGQKSIVGLHDVSGGDLAFSEDGTFYLCSFSGLYRLELDEDDVYQASRISADNLPFQPTSMTFDSNKELWLANNSVSSNLIIMDTQTGGWQYKYGIDANNNTDFGRTINDLTTFRVFTQSEEDPDTDGDGIVDREDSYPDDAEKAFEMFTPSKYGWGTVAFEDLWPSNGDYDFNDLSVNYRATAILNAEGNVVQVDFLINTKSNRASYINGFAIEIENVLPSQIESVTGNILIHDYIDEGANGTELGQENAVVVFFDDSNSMLNNENKVSIKFTDPINTNVLGSAPFNPFIIVNKEREKEVHLAYMHTTTLGVKNFEVDGIHNDEDGNYISENGFPWAINIVHDFKVPKEGNAVNSAYNYFDAWATSGGEVYNDWYKDSPGYRNVEHIRN